MLSTRRSHLNFNLVAVGLWLIPTTLFAADPLTEMLRVTPPETSLGLLVRDLRGHHNSVAGGPLAAAFRASPVGKGITAAPELAQIDELGAKVAKVIGMDLSTLRDDVFGDAVVLAYQNAVPSEQRAESADQTPARRRDQGQTRICRKLLEQSSRARFPDLCC